MKEGATTPAAAGDDTWSRTALSALFPWVMYLHDDEFQQFIGDLYAWQNTAAIHSDPALAEQMRVAIADSQSTTRGWPLEVIPASSSESIRTIAERFAGVAGRIGEVV